MLAGILLLAATAGSVAAGGVAGAAASAKRAQAAVPILLLDPGAESARDRWLMVVPWDPRRERKIFSIPDEAGRITLEGMPSGVALVCGGGERVATDCRRLELTAGVAMPFRGPVQGIRATGRVAVGNQPAAGAQISVLLHPVPIRRPFVLPLTTLREDGKAKPDFRSEIRSDERGRFVTPLLAPGEYRLKVRFPNGRYEIGEPFAVPEPAKLRQSSTPKKPGEPPLLDIGEIAVPEGLDLPVTVVDSQGRPVSRATVVARQGEPSVRSRGLLARDRGGGRSHRARPRDPGRAGLLLRSGLPAWQETFEALPGLVRCVLARQAGLEGRIVDEDEAPVAGATVSSRLADLSAVTDAQGRFSFDGLTGGGYELVIAAPGYRARKEGIAVAPEEHRTLVSIRLAAAGSFRLA
jgi:hypothetical protein